MPDRAAEVAVALRLRAETLHHERSARLPGSLPALSPEATQQLLHELTVHQIELEMQNDELRRLQGEIESARARLFDLYDLAPVGYCTLGESGLIVQANLVAATLLGLERSALIRQPLTRFIAREDQDVFYRQRKELAQTGRPQTRDLRLVNSGGHGFWGQLAVSSALGEHGAPEWRVVLTDVTERKRADAALHESQELCHTLVDCTPEAIIVHRDGKTIFANRAAMRLLGTAPAQTLVGKSILELIHADFHAEFDATPLERVHGTADGQSAPAMVRIKLVRLDGTVIDAVMQGTVISYAGKLAVHVVLRDANALRQLNDE